MANWYTKTRPTDAVDGQTLADWARDVGWHSASALCRGKKFEVVVDILRDVMRAQKRRSEYWYMAEGTEMWSTMWPLQASRATPEWWRDACAAADIVAIKQNIVLMCYSDEDLESLAQEWGGLPPEPFAEMTA